MTTWGGESYGIDGGTIIAGPTGWNVYDLYYHYRYPDHHVFSLGDSVLFGGYADPYNWEAFDTVTDPLDIRWVFEVVGGAGTFALHAGKDPDWEITDPLLATEDLGELVVDGAGTYVSAPVTGVDYAFLAAQMEEMVLLLETVSGSIDVKQVKLRVWPSDGPKGGWNSGEAFETTYNAASYSHGQWPINSPLVPTYAEAWTLGVANFDSIDGTGTDTHGDAVRWRASPYDTSRSYEATFYNTRASGSVPVRYFSFVASSSAVFFPTLPSVASNVPADVTGSDPYEILDDLNSRWRAVGGGPLTPTGVSGWHDITAQQGNEGYVSVSATDMEREPHPGFSYFEAPARSAAPLGDWHEAGETFDIIPPTNGAFIVTGYPISYDHYTGVDQVEFSNGIVSTPQYDVSFPSYEYYDPDFVPEAPPGAGVGGGGGSKYGGQYLYLGDVAGAGAVSPPILWFVYQTWGFLGQHFVAYGMGLGDNQSALNGKLYLGPGPPEDYPSSGEFRPVLVEWNVYPAGPHAYDGTGVMFPGTSVAPPVVDVEHQIIEFIVPTSLTLIDPTEYHLYVVNDNGTSNALSLMLYPMIDLDMDGAEPLLMTTTAGMGEHGLDLPGDGPMLMSVGDPIPNIEQRYSLFEFPYALTGRIPERAPTYLTSAEPDFELTGGAPTTGLDDPVSVALPMPLRYRPLDSKITPRPDLGTGISLWEANETSAMDWKFHVSTAPYVDADNVVSSRNGNLTRPAMVFPGNAWAETNASFPAGPVANIVMAVTIFPDAQTRSFILSSFISGVPDPDTFPLNVYVEGDNLSIAVGAKVQVVKIAPGYIGRRPIILAITLSSTLMRSIVVSDKATTILANHAPFTSAGFRFYLGRNNNASSMQIATMDVLDIGINHVGVVSESQLWTIVNRLDGIYGVMK